MVSLELFLAKSGELVELCALLAFGQLPLGLNSIPVFRSCGHVDVDMLRLGLESVYSYGEFRRAMCGASMGGSDRRGYRVCVS